MKQKRRVSKKWVVIILILGLVTLIALNKGKNGDLETDSQVIPVVLETSIRTNIVQRLYTNGDIKGLNQADVYPDVPGKILEVFVSEGQYVGAGQVLATIDRSQTGMIFMPATVRSPISGIVGKIYIEKGRTVAPSVPLMLVADISMIEGVLNVPEKDAGLYKLGQTAEIRTPSYPDETFLGYVSRISSLIDPLTRTLEVRIALINTGNRLIPGNYADFSVIVKNLPDEVVIPYDAVIDMLERREVFVVERADSLHGDAIIEDGPEPLEPEDFFENEEYLIARQRKIITGVRDGQYIQVISGLNPGERVISLGKENVVDGAQVRFVQRNNRQTDEPVGEDPINQEPEIRGETE